MKFLFVSYDALIGDLAWQVIKEGHEVKYSIKNPIDHDVGAGFIPMVDDWRA
ncbi:MAG: phosphoribosylamine--glycine ligase, partial [Pseudohongiellaceae bacterium]